MKILLLVLLHVLSNFSKYNAGLFHPLKSPYASMNEECLDVWQTIIGSSQPNE